MEHDNHDKHCCYNDERGERSYYDYNDDGDDNDDGVGNDDDADDDDDLDE